MRRALGIVLALFTLSAGSATAANEYVQNGSFEGSLSGWGGYNATLTLASGGAVGAQAAKVTRTRGTAYSIFPLTKPVTTTVAGASYTGRAWVRSDKPGKKTCIRIREYAGTSVVGSAEACLTAQSGWQQFAPLVYRPLAGGRALDIYAHQPAAVTGDSFLVDGLSLVDDAAPPADTTPPETQIDSGPTGSTTSTSATFAFSSSESGSTFTCWLDSAAPAACSSPLSYSNLPVGTHTFSVRARDAAGNSDATAATRTWTIDTSAPTTPPETTIASGPAGTTRTNEPTFTLSSDRAGASFECSLDGKPFATCTSPYTAYVETGGHRLDVRAVDAGGADATPASRSWWSDGLLQNGNFESASAGWTRQNFVVAGWKGYNANLSQVAGGVRGAGAGKVALSTGTSYSIYSSPKPVNSSVAGASYTVTGLARSDTPGRTVCLRVREFANGVAGAGAQSCLVATTAWEGFAPVAFTASAEGNEIEVYVYQSTSATAGDSFEVDGITLADGAADPVLPAAGPDPVLIGVSDIASCWSSGDETVARIVDVTAGTIGIAGDTEQNYGTAEEFAGCYDPAWGRHKWRTKPAVGDHEYRTYTDAYPYFDYFGESAGPRFKGFYSYELGSWHIVVLRSQNCLEAGGCGPGSEQYEWLKADLAANAKTCTAAYFHHPRWSVGSLHGNQEYVQPFWDLLYQYSTEFVYGGNDHTYQRWAPQNPQGELDPDGIRQFIVGEGGTQHYGLVSKLPANVEVANTGSFGVTAFTLRNGAYDWRFIGQPGKAFSDMGSAACSPLPAPDTAPTASVTSPAAGSTVAGTVALSASAADDKGVSKVEFLVDGAVVGTDTTAPYSASWDSTSHADGSASIQARATDTAGATTLSAAVAVTVKNAVADTTAPETAIDSGPSGDTSSADATFAFSADEAGASFECSLDGGAYGPCTSPTSYSGLTVASHSFAVRARDAAGNLDPTPATRSWNVVSGSPPPASGNLLANGGFESSTDGWRGYNATLALVTGGAEGSSAVRVSYAGSGSSYSLYPSPRPVTSTVLGERFTASGQVRSSGSGSLCLRIREYAGSALAGSALSCVTATASWQAIPPILYTALGSGNELEVYAYTTTVATGASFDVDALSLTRS